MKFSIIVLYSNDRKDQLLNSIRCWSDCAGFQECEKILCVDGKTNINPDGWQVMEVIRKGDFYCWADAINTGVKTADNDVVFYLDSDRIVPINFFAQCLKVVLQHEKCFVYPKYLYSLNINADTNLLRQIRDNIDEFKHILVPDHRQNNPLVFYRKNSFSGCVCFKKDCFLSCGGFDENFCGWGYPDYDFLINITRKNIPLIGLEVNELHQKHGYSSNDIKLHNLWNLKQYVKKWGLPIEKLEEFRMSLNISSDTLYETKSLKHFLSLTSRNYLLL